MNTFLTALFAILIVVVLVDAVRVWIAALGGRTLSGGSEDPYVESTIWAPSGLIPTREERAHERALAGAGAGRDRGDGA